MTPPAHLRIKQIHTDKLRYLPLLLTGDESADMINRYIDRGNLFAGFIADVAVAVCVTTEESSSLTEIKNLAVHPDFQRRGFGRQMLNHVESLNRGKTMTLGTGETPSTLHFYKSCGYAYSHRIPDFFTDNYPNPIIEEGVQLRDMIYLTKKL